VGCSHTFFVVKTTRPSGAKVEWSVPDASVPPTGVKTIRISPVRLRANGPRDGPRSSVAWLTPCLPVDPPILVLDH